MKRHTAILLVSCLSSMLVPTLSVAPAVAEAPAVTHSPADAIALALANVDKGAGTCSLVNPAPNSLGGTEFETSCVGWAGVPEYWCADFATWVWRNSGLNVTGLNADVVSFTGSARKNGSTVHTDRGYHPQLGDAAVYSDEHVGLVTAIGADGSIQITNGDFGGDDSSTEAHFAQTSLVVNETVKATDIPVGSFQSTERHTVTAYVTPSAVTPARGFWEDLATWLSGTGAGPATAPHRPHRP